MTMQGDDCYFYYYSNCTKGDSCPFRHCEAAMGSETTCTLWKEQRCFRNICKFRHMEIDKNRKEIPCYWENQPAGCQKPHCAFHHKKPRVIDGSCIPPDKGHALKKDKEEPHEDQVNQVSAPTSNHTNPQIRGVIRTETQENVPSPTHPPVVINPVDDDDEDDQFSEEGDESIGGSPRKLIISKNDSLNFGIQTLEEIRLRKSLMANLKKAGQPYMHGSPQNSGNAIEKENIQAFLQSEIKNARNDSSNSELGKNKIADRLGKRILKKDAAVEEDIPLKRCIAERLGGFIESSTDMPPQKAQKPVRERLGLTNDLATTNSEPTSSGDIRIKTLEEIRQEKAARTLNVSKVVKERPVKEPSPSKKTGKPSGAPQVKTFSEILYEKKKMREEKAEETNSAAGSPERNEGHSTVGAAVKTPATAGEVRVKTLEEIRREKAARMQAQLQETTNKSTTSCEVESSGAPKRRILRINKTSPATNTVGQTKQDTADKKPEPVTEANGKPGSSSEPIKVKTFEEIMREKRLRKQQEEQGTSAIQKEAESSVSAASSPASEPSIQPQTSVRQRITLKPKTPPVPAAVAPQKKSPERSEDSAPSLDTPKPSTPTVIPVQLAEGTIHTVETKVKPKVNVKPSVVKPAVQPAQKRKVSKVHHSAIAEVKPLNAGCQTPSAPVMPNKRQKLPTLPIETDTQQVPSNTEDVNMVPTEDVKMEPIVEPSSTTSKASESVAVLKSPVTRTPSLRFRRSSSTTVRSTAVAVTSSSSMDDFEDLLDEFTDDRLEDELELDSGKGEDDLLLELSEMIDS